MSLIIPNETVALSNIVTSGGSEKAENQQTTDLSSKVPSVTSSEKENQQELNEQNKSGECQYPAPSKSCQGDRPAGWESVRKRLGTLVAVKTVMDTQKKHKTKRPVDQKDFLERFSTRENTSMRNAKKTSINTAARRISLVQKTKTCNISFEKDPNREDSERPPLNDWKCKDTIVVDHSNAEENTKYRRFHIRFSSILYTFFEPYSNVIYYWLYIVNLAITYNAWIILLRIAFLDAQTQYQTLWFLFDYAADFIYILDIIISSRTSFLENGIYVDDLKRVAMSYLKSYQFALDVSSVLPLDILYLANGTTPTPRLLRILKYYKTFVSQKTILALTTYPNVLRTIIFLHLMLIMMHWNACLYFIISRYEGFGVNDWVYPSFIGKTKSLSFQYAFCYYWSTLSLTTIGGSNHPETTLECAFMIVCYVIGIFIFASIVGQAGNVIQNMSASRIEFEQQRDSSIQYMKRHNVPEDMQRRVRLWYDYSYSRGRFQGSDINDMRLLPNKMKTELALHVHLETLRRVTFLQKCQPEFLHDLVLKMKMIIYTPGDYVCRKGEIAREMYVISDGVLEVISEAGRILKELHSGDFFGEIGILSLSKGQDRRTADVRAYGYVELFVLSKEDVLNATKEYPLAQKILAKYGRSRLKQDSNRKDGPRMDTSTSDSDDERASPFPNLNGSQGINQSESRHSLDSRRSSCRRSLCRRGSDRRSYLKVRMPMETDVNDSRLLPISDQFAQSSSVVHGTMMSVINSVVNPVSSVVVGVKSPTLSERRKSVSSVLVNSNAIRTESEEVTKSCEQSKKHKCARDTDKILEFMQASQDELLEKMMQNLKKRMEKHQKKILEKLQLLEEATLAQKREVDELRDYVLSKEENVSLKTEGESTYTFEVNEGDNLLQDGDCPTQERRDTVSFIPEICCE